jgi:hypothetical protein
MGVIRIYCQLLKLKRKFFDLPRTLWWKLVPGVTVKVAWPHRYDIADPNIHYRPWLEQEVGRQFLEWDWDLIDDDIIKNLLTIRFRFDKKQYATLVKLKWA